jgi:threonine 3-dehydrogenase
MRALSKLEAKPGIWMVDVPVPEIGADDVLVKVHKTGICGTDVHIYKWDDWARRTVPVPMVVGHEFAGEIAAVGANVTHLRVGQRASGEGHVVGMKSRASRGGKYHLDPDTRGIGVDLPGAFAEYLRLPAFNVIPLPDQVDDEIGAVLDPLGNAVHTALAFDLVGEDVLVTGAGPIGIMGAAVALKVGARHVVITDVNPERLALAAKVVPQARPVDVGREDLRAVMRGLGMHEGFDVALEMSGAPAALDTIVEHLVMGGRVALLGLPAQPFIFDLSKIVLRMVTLRGIYGREMFETWYLMSAMLGSGLDVSDVITDRSPASEWETAFATAREGLGGNVLIEWSERS